MKFLSIETDHIVSWLMGMPSDTNLNDLVEAGIPLKAIETLTVNGIDIMNLVVMPHPLTEEHVRGDALTPDAGLLVYRGVTVIVLAEALLGNRDYAIGWATSCLRGLGGTKAMQLIATDEGFDAVVVFIERIAHGVYN